MSFLKLLNASPPCCWRVINKLIHLSLLLQTYPPRQEGESLVSTAEDAYTHAKDFLEGIQLNQEKTSSTSKYRDHREKNLKHVVSCGTFINDEMSWAF